MRRARNGLDGVTEPVRSGIVDPGFDEARLVAELGAGLAGGLARRAS